MGLAPPDSNDPAQRLAALCGVWLARLHDLHATRLGTHGPLAKELSALLDPPLERLEQEMSELLHLGQRGAER